MTNPWHLIADIGGTNARFSALKGCKLGAPVIYDIRQGESLQGTSIFDCFLDHGSFGAVRSASGTVS